MSVCVSLWVQGVLIFLIGLLSAQCQLHTVNTDTHTHTRRVKLEGKHTHTHACAHTRSQINTNRHSDTHTGRVSVVHFDNALCVKETWRSKSLSKKKKKNCRKTHTHTNSGKHCVEVRDGEQE